MRKPCSGRAAARMHRINHVWTQPASHARLAPVQGRGVSGIEKAKSRLSRGHTGKVICCGVNPCRFCAESTARCMCFVQQNPSPSHRKHTKEQTISVYSTPADPEMLLPHWWSTHTTLQS